MTTGIGNQLDPAVSRHRRAARSAFTLLELVVSMAMVAVLAVSLYASMKIAFKAQSSAETAVEPVRTVELAMDLIRVDIQSAMTPKPNTTNLRVLAGPFVGTEGTDDRGHDDDDLIFCTTAEGPPPGTLQANGNQSGSGQPNGGQRGNTAAGGASQSNTMNGQQVLNGYGDIRQVELNVITDGTDHVLLRRVTSNLLADVQVDPDDEVLCRGVSAFRLRYFNGSDWAADWDSRDESDALPTAVEVTLELERPNGTVMNAQGQPVMRYVRIFQLPCSAVSQNANQVNFGN